MDIVLFDMLLLLYFSSKILKSYITEKKYWNHKFKAFLIHKARIWDVGSL